jgi:hypothetical protein
MKLKPHAVAVLRKIYRKEKSIEGRKIKEGRKNKKCVKIKYRECAHTV